MSMPPFDQPHRPLSRGLTLALSFSLALAACGGGGGNSTPSPSASPTTTTVNPTFTVSGSVSGLASGQQVTLKDNGADSLPLGSNGSFIFAAPIALNGSYSVTVSAQPTGQTCTVGNGTGSGVTASISNVTVTCSTNTFTIGGTIGGLLAGQQVTLDDNNADPLNLSANGVFTFATPIAFGSGYAVTVGTQPTGQTCSVTSGSGSGVSSNVNNVVVNCSTNSFTVGGTLTGLSSGAQVTLQNNGADPVTLTANGNFSFATPVVFGGSYAVTATTQPASQFQQYCAVTTGTGTVAGTVAGVQVACGSIEKVLYPFTTGGPDGSFPYSGVVLDAAGNLYGAATDAGSANVGTVYKLAPGASGYTASLLHAFTNSAADGAFPQATPILDSAGNLYGTTVQAGNSNKGAVYRLAPDGAGGYTTSILYSFAGGNDGSFPIGAGLIMDSAGNLYGVTGGDGIGTFFGTAYRLAPNGTGGYTETILYNFTGGADGGVPSGNLVMDSGGNLYGTTSLRGSSNFGTVFKLTPSGAGYTQSTLHTFTGGADGAAPQAGVVMDGAGNLYGTTFSGGSPNFGTVFELTPDGAGGYTEAVIYTFTGGTDGGSPNAALLVNGAGDLYGTTTAGGAPGSFGNVFELAPNGSGGYTESVLYDFTNGSDGSIPTASLIADGAGNLYGTAGHAGSGAGGVVFEIQLH